ncbi:lipid-binding SYLF domain-containing protein [Arenibacter sp. M-2]|uniref:lipid-binding SYLF domain-containing protein n=1 Tax=unclassified Arenibacter TaxID=2615047 RepID=UPI000D76E6AE|nr:MULTISPECIES: lipid-binding SYLF domain-containing protein [unclassified Arenibacter]MDL5512079.1 lipid-binding SYLF domain-containing protein [Arenibacter sp. M-2]
MKILKLIPVLLALMVSVSVTSQTRKEKQIISDASKAKKTLLKAQSGLQTFFDNSAGYVIFPNVGKGGFVVGAASGNGAVYEGGEVVGMAGLKKLNVGLQAGGQAIIEVIFFEDNNALNEFKQGNFSFAAEVSAVALKSGIGLNAKYKEGVAVFVLPKAGLMADASVGGQKFSFHSF